MTITQNKEKTKRVMHPNSLANLKPIQPGEVRNPGGRPKDRGITPIQIEMMDEPCPYAKDPETTWRGWLAEKGLLQVASKPEAMKDYKNRVEGPVIDGHAVLGDIVIEIVHRDKGG